ncbi:microtubule-associated protein futsch-like isoform X1 [Drosophila miranda]|uniref:microtubule-associated protein futsch-like isoform X1 n=1 Tax=Drosophila miranda TaxID=7229 RepID=UPI00143F5CFF|nr:microtubule-associated protein futsch-like isoform X1 [Drosophila miranda]
MFDSGMAAVSLSINGQPAVLLQPDTVYRIGRKEAYEFCVADESMELLHALAIVYRAGVLRVLALMGKVFVNGLENGNVDISRKDAIDGKVKLRFGNVAAEAQIMEPIQHHDSSGFGESLKDTSVDTTSDSLVIPETEVQSVNTSANTTVGSFFVPETQAVVFDKGVSKGGKVSLGDDFMIPETQDLLSTPPVVVHNEKSNSIDEDASEMGTQIRICTQEFNNFDEDAFDDFDSSMIMGDSVTALSLRQRIENKNKQDVDEKDLELSALNWSATNPKCTVLNSTKAGELSPRELACIAPDLSGQNPSQNARNCTPDLFDLMNAGNVLSAKTIDKIQEKAAKIGNTPEEGVVEKIASKRVGRPRKIKTPTSTPQDTIQSKIKKENPPEKENANTSAVAKRRVGRPRKSQKPTEDKPELKVRRSETSSTTDKITTRNTSEEKAKGEPQSKAAETREFRELACITPDLSGQNPSQNAGNCTPDLFDLMNAGNVLSERSATPTLCGLKQLIVATIETPTATPIEVEDKENQDFIVTPSKEPASESPKNGNENNETNQDFIAPQPFPFHLKRKQERLQATESLKDRPDGELINQDFIETQPFPSKLKQNAWKAADYPKDRSYEEETNQDFIATQPFPLWKKKNRNAAESTEEHRDSEDNQDFIATEAFPSISKQASKNTPENKENIPVEKNDTEPKASTSKDAKNLNSRTYNEIMEILDKMAAGLPQPPDDPNEPQIKFVEPSIIMDENYNAKVARLESIYPDRDSKRLWGLPKLPEVLNSRIAGSESPPRTTRNACQRRLSDESPRIEPRKRPAAAENSPEPKNKISRLPLNSFIEEDDKKAADKESTPELVVSNTQLDSASHSKVKKTTGPQKEEQASDMESSPELVVKVRPGRSKRSTSTQLDSASHFKVKKKIEPKKEEQTADKESSYSKVKKTVEPKQEEQDVPDAPRSRLRNAKTIDKIQEKAAKIGNTPEEGVVEKIASKRVGRPRKIKTPTSTPQDTIQSKIKKENPPEKENANTSAVAKRRVGRPRKSQKPTEDKPELKVRRSETSSTTDKITTRNTSEEKAKGEPQSKAAETREFRELACITPDLSGQNPSQNAGNCTPDLFDLMNAGNVLSAKTIDKIQEKAAKIGNTPEEGVVEKIASKRVGRPRKIKTPTSTPQENIQSKIKKENPPEKENANTSAVAKRRVGRPRKSQKPTNNNNK